MDLSYTGMAASQRPIMLAGPAEQPLPVDLEAWFNGLPPVVQNQVKAQTAELVRTLPEALQVQLAQQFAAKGETSPVPIPALNGLAGLGCPCMMKGMDGLGQWDTLFSGLLNAGTQAYNLHQTGQLQTSIASSTNATNTQIAQIQADASVQMQTILAQAQVAATQATASSKSSMLKYAVIFGGIAALLMAGGGAVYLAKRKKS